MPGKRRRLAERRRAVGHAQEQLTALLGVEQTTVQRWEVGETTPQPWLRPKLAEVLGVSLEELDDMLAEGQPEDEGDAAEELLNDREPDPVLIAPWNHRGTVEAVVVVSGGGGVKRRGFFLTGPALTAPAHQWLVHEPGSLVSGLSGRRVGTGLAEQLTAMVTEVRKMDDIAGGGSVLSLAAHDFGWAAGLLENAVYDEHTGRMLCVALAELGHLCGWATYDAGQGHTVQAATVLENSLALFDSSLPVTALVISSISPTSWPGQASSATWRRSSWSRTWTQPALPI